LTTSKKISILEYNKDIYMSNIAVKLENINNTLQLHNEITQKILNTVQKPENKFIKVLQVIGLGAGALAIFNIIENIIKWIMGGG